MAMKVNNPAEILPTESPKFNKPTPKEPKMTVKFNHERKVLSLAKNTLGSTLAGNAIRFEADMVVVKRSENCWSCAPDIDCRKLIVDGIHVGIGQQVQIVSKLSHKM